jgi:transposase
MQVLYVRCAGLDVHKKTVVACMLVTGEDAKVQEQVRSFGAMTGELSSLSRWLQEQQVEQVALESTGVYWWPVFDLLEEDGHAVLLVNPQHVKAVPGRKTDVSDSRWLADLLRHGLLPASFIPPATIRQLRDLTRYRKALVGERTQEVNRLQKVLESANIKLAGVVTDILGGERSADVDRLGQWGG